MAFHLNTGHQRSLTGFQNRTSDVFGSLGGLERDYDDRVKERGPDDGEDDANEKESIEHHFKRPDLPHSSESSRGQGKKDRREEVRWRQRGPPTSRRAGEYSDTKRQKTPDYKIHPERWTEYSLADTDISGESTNKRAAIDFLRDLRERKARDQSTDAWDAELYCGKIQFKKPVEKSSCTDGQEPKRHLHSNVHTMPEYVIGENTKQRSGKKRPRLSQSGGPGSCGSGICLDHLEDADSDNQSEQAQAKLGQLGEKDSLLAETSQSEPSEEKGGISSDDPRSALTSDIVSPRKETDQPTVSFQKKGKGKLKIRKRKTTDEG